MTTPSTANELFFADTEVAGVEFRDRSGIEFTSVKSRFRDCRFEKLNIEQATFGGGKGDSTYLDCRFRELRICARAPGYARFEGCEFDNVVFTEFFAFGIEFVNCTFSGVFKKGFLNGRVPERSHSFLSRTVNEIRDNDFRQVEFGDFAFRTGVDLSRQLMPEGSGYLLIRDAAMKLPKLRSELSRIDASLLKPMVAVLNLMEDDIRGGQRDVFLSASALTDEDQSVLQWMRRYAD